MSKLGDDEVASILMRLYDPNDRKSSSLVCKQWLRVEGLTRLSIRVLEPDFIQSSLPRFPNLLTFRSSNLITDAQLKFIANTCSKLEDINLNIYGFDEEPSDDDDFGDDAVCGGLANGCRDLIRVCLRRRCNVGNIGVINLVKHALKLTTLDLGRCCLINDSSLEAIGSMNCIISLNLEACSLITDHGLKFLVTGSSSRTLKKLNLAECDRVTDLGVWLLKGLVCLEELNLAECGPKVTNTGGVAIASIPTLRKLNISWLINVTDVSIVLIARSCRSLVSLDLTGCEMVTDAGVCLFAEHECLESLILTSCYNISGIGVDKVLKCKSLSSIVLDRRLKKWIPEKTLQKISKYCQLHWR
ncbi:uncharacterized protein LOC126659910 [Mercurialis annua]|uniref:uncharacterized protein LOC126659910 n=1 Tax=Mercurialis annua TaxID=3986 RepID=UPI0021608233|nr:uncharacterized protein LOC126659910 [Mercurialis annua]